MQDLNSYLKALSFWLGQAQSARACVAFILGYQKEVDRLDAGCSAGLQKRLDELHAYDPAFRVAYGQLESAVDWVSLFAVKAMEETDKSYNVEKLSRLLSEAKEFATIGNCEAVARLVKALYNRHDADAQELVKGGYSDLEGKYSDMEDRIRTLRDKHLAHADKQVFATDSDVSVREVLEFSCLVADHLESLGAVSRRIFPPLETAKFNLSLRNKNRCDADGEAFWKAVLEA